MKCNVLKLKLLAVFWLGTYTLSLAAHLPQPKDIDELWNRSSDINRKFLKETFVARAGFDYSGDFLNDQDRKLVLEIAESSAKEFSAIIKSLEKIRTAIENYEGDDWDELFGTTCAWRKCQKLIKISRQRKITAKLSQAAALTESLRKFMLADIITELSDDSVFEGIDRKLIFTKAKWLEDRKKNREVTIRRIDSILTEITDNPRTYLETSIFRFVVSGKSELRQIYRIADEFSKGSFADEYKLLFGLALHEIKHCRRTLIDKICLQSRGADITAGKIVLGKALSDRNHRLNIVEAELAAAASLNITESGICGIFEDLLKDKKFQTPIIYLAAGQGCSKDRPAESVACYMKAVIKAGNSEKFINQVSILEIAHRAALLGYDVYYKNSEQLVLAKKAIELYCRLAGENADEQIEYLYASLLINLRENNKADPILKKIAKGKSKLARNAQLDLIFNEAEKSENHPAKRQETVRNLEKLIEKFEKNGSDDSGWNARAYNIYCQLLIDQGGMENAARVLEIVLNGKCGEGINVEILKAAAYAETGNYIKAVSVLSKIDKTGNCQAAKTAGAVVSEILEKIDEFQANADNYSSFIKKCQKLIIYSLGCANRHELVYYYTPKVIEIGIIAAEIDNKKFDKLESLINGHSGRKDDDIEWLRCKGRLYTAQKRYKEAYYIWSRICQARKTISTDRPWKWWRAKYFALKCFSEMEGIKDDDVFHAVEVLMTSADVIPQFWEQKIRDLVY